MYKYFNWKKKSSHKKKEERGGKKTNIPHGYRGIYKLIARSCGNEHLE